MVLPPDFLPADATDLPGGGDASAAVWRAAAPHWPALLAGRGQVLAVKDAASGRYRGIGSAWRALLGLDPADCVGRTDVEIFGGGVASAWRAADQMALDRADAVASDHAFEWRGQWREFSVTRQAVSFGGEPARQILSHWVDVRAQRQQARQLAETLESLQRTREAVDALRRGAAPGDELRDAASGLAGRAPFIEQMRREFDLSAREGREMALVLLELDAPGGEGKAASVHSDAEVANEIGSWLRSGTRTMDATARLGPTRYAILLSGAGLSIAARRAEALRATRPPTGGPTPPATRDTQAPSAEDAAEAPIAVGVSMGVASYPLSADSPEALMQAAELALQRAQARGGNQVALAGLSLGDRAGR